MRPSEIIREARNQLFERGWTQREAESSDGRVCIMGAVNFAVYGRSHCPMDYDAEKEGLRNRVADLLSPTGAAVAHWNDAPGRTFDEVIEHLDKAEKLAEAAENVS